MVFPRLIPILLVHSGRLEKSHGFGSWKYVGDTLNAIKIFNEKDVDEILVLDVDATRQGRGPDFAMLEQLAGECFMPLAYGGGIHSVETARRVSDCGIEKVVLNSAVFARPSIVTDISSVLGSSSTVVSVDVSRKRNSYLRYDHVSRLLRKKENLAERIAAAVDAGAGEIILQSKDRDGTLAGPDLAMLQHLAPGIPVPLVYAGGVSSLAECEAVWGAGASGVAAGSWFVFRGPHRAVVITYPSYGVITESFERVAIQQ